MLRAAAVTGAWTPESGHRVSSVIACHQVKCLPRAGGLYDQPEWFPDLFIFYSNQVEKHLAEEMKRQSKQPATG